MEYVEFLKNRYNAVDETFYDVINFEQLFLTHKTVFIIGFLLLNSYHFSPSPVQLNIDLGPAVFYYRTRQNDLSTILKKSA